MKNLENYPNHTVAVYGSHVAAESAVKVLSTNGFNMKHLSIIGQDYETEERPIGFVNAGDRMLSWGKLGAFWGSVWGLLFGSAMFFIPGIGYMLFAGYIVAMIEGAAVGGGLAALAGALASIGIPKDSVLDYEADLRAGSFLLLIEGSELETKRAKDLLDTTSPKKVESYSAQANAVVL